MTDLFRKIKIFATLVCLFTAYLFGVQSCFAEDDISSDYKQTTYDQDSGLSSSEVNCIYQTQSGYIWVGTDGGLYRYNGNEFKLFNLWNTDKADVYYINNLFQDSEGRLWVSTNNYGLFMISGRDVVHFTEEYYSGVKCINSVMEGSNGVIYVATAYGVYTVNENNNTLVRNEILAKHNIKDMTFCNDKIWGIYNGNTIFSIDSEGRVGEVPSSDYISEEILTISSDDDGYIYIGTIGNEIMKFKNLNNVSIISSSKNGINKIASYDGRIYICTDTGVGYFENDAFVEIKNLNIDSYVSDIIRDYEGNLWISSSKSGLLYLSKGKFSNFNRKYGLPENDTSCVEVIDGFKYIGSDEGLYILDRNNQVFENKLTEYMKDIPVRDIMHDSKGNIWFSTYRRYGVVRYDRTGEITNVNKNTGILSNLVNCTCETANGNVAIATEDGISIVTSKGNFLKNYNYDNGLEYSNIIALYCDEKGKLYAGSDGGGLYIIDGDVIKNYTDADGLTSNVVSCIVKGENGLWIGTNNGLSYFDGVFRSVSNIDFSNNIYDMHFNDDKLYIIGSKGIINATEDELLSTTPLSERYYSSGDGIENGISANSKNCIDDSIIYICSSNGVITFNTKDIVKNTTPPKITVSEVDIDGEKFYYDKIGEELVIDSDTQRVEISFAVLSFSNRENIQIQYQLLGFDNQPEYLSGNENLQAVYTNLDGGEYVFKISAVNGDGVRSEQELTFNIKKEKGFFERTEVIVTLLVLLFLFVVAILTLIFRLWRKFKGKNIELEEMTKKHEDVVKTNTAKTDYLANMSNEIKLPINAMISSASNILKEGTADEDTQRELSEIIDKGNVVLGKVDETILLARLESGAEEVINEPYSITTLICDISDSMLNKLTDLPIKFLVDLGDDIPDILIGDFDKIKTVLTIILDNSIKYTKEGSITLSVDYYDFSNSDDTGVESNLIFSVSDTGVGITEDRLEHIFEIYYVDEAKKSVENTGNGVSLSIAKKISDIIGGELEVESTYGAGATFTFAIKQKKLDKDGQALPMNDNTIERVSREEAERMWAPNLHVLLVDDVELSRNVAVDVIKAMEIKCDTAASGPSAIDMVMNNDYDLVLMDIAMPVMNGIDTLREIRELSGDMYKELPVVAMSEDVIGKNRQDIINEGFSDVILKPFDISVLAGILNRFADPEKIKYRTNDVTQYLSESRYSEGLKKLEDYFDVKGVLTRIGGNIDVYNKILSTFYNQNKDSAEELSNKIDTDYRGFRIKIHNIRTGCQNIGAFEAAEITLRVENAINLGNKGYARDNLALIYDCLSVIIEAIEGYLAFVDSQKGVSDEEYAELHKKNQTKSEGTSTEILTTESDSNKASDASSINKDDTVSNIAVDSISNIPSDILANEIDNVEMVEITAGKESDQESGEIFENDEKPRDINIVNISKLKKMREATYTNDWNTIKNIYADISQNTYGSEDTEFLKALKDVIDSKDMVSVNDLLNTYINLKSSL